MIVRVVERVSKVKELASVWVATDSVEIKEVVEKYGFNCALTGNCRTGTDRVAELALKKKMKRVINVQGDEPLIDLALVRRLAEGLRNLSEGWITACCKLKEIDLENPHAVKVEVGEQGHVIRFFRTSKETSIRAEGQMQSVKIAKHIGIYGFAPGALQEFTLSDTSSAEEKLSLEQLRVFPQTPFKIIETDISHPSVDRPEDLSAVLNLLEN